MIEEWRDIEGYEGLYQVSNLCRVKSLERTYIGGYGAVCKKEEHIMKNHVNTFRHNRKTVVLCKDGKTKRHYISVLVAKAFIPNPDNLPEVDHINGNPSDDFLENYRWVDRKGNMQNPNTKKKLSEAVTKEDRKRRSERMKNNNPNIYWKCKHLPPCL